MNRGYHKLESVVLNSFDYGESDRILTLYTLASGKLKGIAKGARRSRRRFVGNIEPLSHLTVIIFHNAKSDLVRIEDATLIDGFSNLKGDLQGLASGSYLAELVIEMTAEGQANPALFALLVRFLRMLDHGAGAGAAPKAGRDALLRYFEIKFLSALGYMPYLEGCVVCKDSADVECADMFFSSDKGGLVCRGCARALAGLLPISGGTARFLAMAERLASDKLARLVPTPLILEQGETVLEEFIRHHTGRELKTRRFMKKLAAGA